MKRLIIKTNQWYDNLPDGKRTGFFLFFVLGSLIVAQYFTYVENFVWAFPIWAFVICFWRVGYVFDWYSDKYLETTVSIKEEIKAVVITESIQSYNAVPHTKIKSEKSPNEDLRRLMEIGHKKEKETVGQLSDKGLNIDLLTNYLAISSETEMSHVLNTIVRETKEKKSKLEK